MITRRTRVQLVIFAVVSIVMVAVTSVLYLRLPQQLGIGQYDVTADFADTSGLYANALVTYRGMDVGRVRGLDLRADGVTVRMSIDDERRIPANVTARIRSTSAIGEQYVDLEPATVSGPMLRDGAEIERARTKEMPQVGPLLDSLDALVESVPEEALGRLLTNVAVSFEGSSDDVDTLLTASAQLVSTASDHVESTRALLRDLGPVLQTQEDLADQTLSSVADLESFTKDLAGSSDHLLRLLLALPAATSQVLDLQDRLEPTLPVLLSSLTTVGDVVYTYLPGVQQVLVIYPPLVSDLIADVLPYADRSAVPLDFRLNLNDPPTCTKGFIPVKDRRDPSETSLVPTPPGLYCKEPVDAVQDVRGARNLPCLNNPGVRAASPKLCRAGAPANRRSGASDLAATPYDPATGGFSAPDGARYLLGSTGPTTSGGSTTWQQLLLRAR
ncbi:MlaD family protein [Aeromicrobium sp. NPDC092404]|uniref:MlaD family protein n=1 Tax=Aeromicrobium sp. NPDC092404 TaxID=3154976 RepID=UPI003426E761